MSGKPESNALPAYMYGDPSNVAERAEAQRCDGCKHLNELLNRQFCGRGVRTLKRCKKYHDKQGG